MLVLARKLNESIQIGDTTVTVLRFKGNAIRLGIDAPRGVAIVRPELLFKEKKVDMPTDTTEARTENADSDCRTSGSTRHLGQRDWQGA